MNIRFLKSAMLLSVLSLGAVACAQPAHAQLPPSVTIKTTAIKPPKPGEVKEMTSADLKAAIGYAMQNGDLDQKDGKELIDKITDIETLMDQFDFMRDQERHMMSSIGSSFH